MAAPSPSHMQQIFPFISHRISRSFLHNFTRCENPQIWRCPKKTCWWFLRIFQKWTFFFVLSLHFFSKPQSTFYLLDSCSIFCSGIIKNAERFFLFSKSLLSLRPMSIFHNLPADATRFSEQQGWKKTCEAPSHEALSSSAPVARNH